MIATVFTTIASLFGGWLNGRIERQKVQLETDLAIERKRVEADVDWEALMAQGSQTSWKDEWWTILLSVPLVVVFIPGGAVYVREGFMVLKESVPEWYMYAVSVAIAASFGVRNIIGKIGKK
jgi:hypothetical protein